MSLLKSTSERSVFQAKHAEHAQHVRQLQELRLQVIDLETAAITAKRNLLKRRKELNAALLAGKASLPELIREFEGVAIVAALRGNHGSVTYAARALGISHQELIYILDSRQKHLANERRPVRRRPGKGPL